MAGIGGASSMAQREGNRVGSCSSENGSKRLKTGEEEEDRLSALPDFLIHRILSHLPATDLVKTLVLSKCWKNQWIHVPVLKFVSNAGMSLDKISNFIDETLIRHDCPNMEKLIIKLKCFSTIKQFPDLDSWIRFALVKNVKEFILTLNDEILPYSFPDFLFNNSSLVKLKLSHCDVMPFEKVNWGSVKSLRLYECSFEDDGAIENVLSGTPMLEYLELRSCNFLEELVIASKSLKTLILDSAECKWSFIEISCPNLERLRISGIIWFTSLRLMNLSSSVYATLDFFFEDYDDFEQYMSLDDCINMTKETLLQVQHVEKLEIGRWLMEMLSSSMEDGDCIGGLPDSVIHRIISFLPSTKDASKTDLYKTGKHKWTDVNIINFVSNEKLVINSKDIPLVKLDPRLSLWIRLATRKYVKELILDCDGANVELGYEYPLPQFLFNNSSLVKMKMCACAFMPNGIVNWESLKSLYLEHSELGDQAIENVLLGSPLLECLELHRCGFQGELVIASEHLKKFVVDDFGQNCHLLEILCPNLGSLAIRGNMGSTSLKLMNLPSTLHATLHLYVLESADISPDDCMNLVEKTKKQILHVKDLEIKLTMIGASKPIGDIPDHDEEKLKNLYLSSNVLPRR